MDLIKMGRLIKHVRNMKGLTQEELAKRIYIKPNTVSQYENGKRLPETEALILLCRELDLLPIELFVGHRIQREQITRKELLAMLKEDNTIKYSNNEGWENEIDLTDYLVVTLDRKEHFSDVWIPYEEEDLYTQEELFAMQEKQEK